MSKKFWLIILILFFILVSVFYWYFNNLPNENNLSKEISPAESPEEEIQTEKSKNFQTIELEKPPFIQD